MSMLLKRTNYLIFKSIFGDEKNTDILASFLKAALRLPDEEYSHLTLTNPASTIARVDDKTVVLDVKVYTKSRHIINVEIQVADSPELRHRFAFYASKLLTEQIYKGQSYQLKKVVGIIITDFVFIPENNAYHNVYQLHDAKTGSTFTDLIEINTLELKKLDHVKEETPLLDWLRFLKTEDEVELSQLATKNKASKGRHRCCLN
ncbi:MAG: Rpn family recombination-promoting nuclease/putative transposase [Turicibacter sp.]|nr:Rpn family recombination-promoting nuclease/putative transposase [Turicibacter sp.]